MKFAHHSTRILFLLLLGLILPACGALPFPDGTPDAESSLVQTIPPGTLTAISELAMTTETPAPNPLGVPWADLDGLELDFWYVWDLDEPGMGMNAIADRFNEENEWGITVIPRDQGLVLDPLTSVEAAFEEGLVPHLMVGDSAVIAGWYQSGLTVDLTRFLNDQGVGMSAKEQEAFYPGLAGEFYLDGSVRPGWPFSQSVQVIYYNESWANELGIKSIPLSAEDFHAQSCRLTENGTPAGLVISPQAANILSFIFAYGGDPLDSADGLYDFSSVEIKEFANDWRELYLDDCGKLISNYPNPMAIEGEYERFNQRKALMIMGSTLMQAHIQTGPNSSGRGDDWQMLPFLGPEGTRAVVSDVQSVVVFKTSPEEELASWLFLKYLVSPEVQAEWSQYSGYYPTREDSLRFLRKFGRDNPSWAGGLDLLKYSRSAPLHPSWQTVQLAVEDAFEELLIRPEQSPEAQLEALDQAAAELLEWSQE